jgi:predicted CXXCH cytochrome family protein
VRCLLLIALPVFSLQAQQQCAECHPKIARTYAQTGMARSFYRTPAQTAIDPNPFYHQPSGTWYAMVRREGALYQRRWRDGYDGKPAQVQELRVDYVMGSGNHARTYLHRTARGALVELPLAWYPEDGGKWAMGPGHDREFTLAPRTIAYECMGCHNAAPAIPPRHEEPGSEPLYTGALPEGIDCQRCHGSGANHMRVAHTPGAKVEAIRAAIVNPARLTPERQMEVCMQCHLETTSLPVTHSIQRYGRAPFSYRPGEPLANFMIFFEHAPGTGHENDFEIVNSAYRLRQSQCFLRSAGKLTCTTCHNPHDVPRGEQAVAQYKQVCRQCHATPHTAAPDCTGCHMPKRRTQDVVHAVMTDHLIQRRPSAGDLLAPLAERQEYGAGRTRSAVAPYYPRGENSLYTAVAQGLPRLAAEIEKQKPARPEFYIELGQAWLAAGKRANAIAAFDEAVNREPDSPVAALNLGDALTQAGQTPRAIAVLNRAIQAAPGDALLWYQLGIAHNAAGREAEAIAAWRKCVTLDPDMAEAHNLLGAALAGSGDLESAEKSLQRALAIYPDLAEAQGNLGHLYAMRGDFRQAAFYLDRSIKLKPNDAEARTNYAVALTAMGRLDDAQQQVDAAVAADPKSPDARNFRGTLLDRKGAREEALAEFLEAVKLRPDFGIAHLNAARLLAAKGDVAGARRHLQQASTNPDPGIRQRAAAMLQQIR